MAASQHIPEWSGPSRRRVPRFQLHSPLDVTVLRSGIPDTVPGRSLNVCEGGIAAMLAGELTPGEAVGIEVQLPLLPDPLRTRATVRHQDRLRCGLEFVGLSTEQRASIRDWVKEAKAQPEVSAPMAAGSDSHGKENQEDRKEPRPRRSGNRGGGSTKPRQHRTGWVILLLFLLLIAAGVFWWRWNLAWQELESGLKTEEPAVPEKPQAEVPAEVMVAFCQ